MSTDDAHLPPLPPLPVVDDTYPNLADTVATHLLDGTDREVLAARLDAAAEAVRAGAFDPREAAHDDAEAIPDTDEGGGPAGAPTTAPGGGDGTDEHPGTDAGGDAPTHLRIGGVPFRAVGVEADDDDLRVQVRADEFLVCRYVDADATPWICLPDRDPVRGDFEGLHFEDRLVTLRFSLVDGETDADGEATLLERRRAAAGGDGR